MEEGGAITEAKQRKGQYTEIALQAKAEGISRILKSRRALARAVQVDITDLEALQIVADEYERSCEKIGTIPNFSGLCSCLGIARSTAYTYIRKHGDSPTARFFDVLRTRWASVREDAMSAGYADTASSIFLLKNSGQGYSDRNEVLVEARSPEPRENRPEWAYSLSDEEYRVQLIESIPDEEEGAESE